MRAAALVFLLAAACTAIANEAPVIRNIHSDEPLQPPRTIRFDEEWRIGGAGADIMFGLMVNATCDADGKVYLMDQQLNQVTVVSPAGEILRTLFREGDGPGEIRTPQGIALWPDGTIGLAQQFPGKFIRVDSAGEPAASLTVIGGGGGANEGFTALAGCTSRGGVILAQGMFQVPAEGTQSRTSYVARIDPIEGTEVIRYRQHDTVLDFQKAHLVEREMIAPCYTCALGPDGRTYYARDWREYAVEVLSPAGELECVITRDFTGLDRDQQERDRIDELFEVQAAQMPFPITWEIEPQNQVVGGLHVWSDGTLWVSHNRSEHELPDGIMTRWDAYTTDGRWLQEVRLACDADPRYDGFLILNDDRVLLVKGLILAQLTATGSQGAVFDEEGGTEEIEVICGRFVD